MGIIAGLGFALFQTVNRRAIKEMDVFAAALLKLLDNAVAQPDVRVGLTPWKRWVALDLTQSALALATSLISVI